jgi:hypothetical protein
MLIISRYHPFHKLLNIFHHLADDPVADFAGLEDAGAIV